MRFYIINEKGAFCLFTLSKWTPFLINLTLSVCFKIQGSRLHAIVAPKKGLE